MNQPRKHHYLPQFYLRGFSPDQSRLFQIEKTSGSYYRCQIKDTAAIRDYHEIDGDNAEDPYAVEKELAKIESLFAKHLRILLKDGVSNETALSETVAFLSLLRMRVPAIKEHIENSLASIVKASAKVLDGAGKLPRPPQGLEEILRINNLKITIQNWKCLALMFSMAASPDVLSIMNKMRATLYRCPNEQFFFTSDQPVALFHPTILPTDAYGVGPFMEGIQITLPLEKKVLMKLDHEPGPHIERIATPDEIKEFNRRTIIMAQNYVFTGAEPESVANQVGLFRNVHAGFRFEDLNATEGIYQIHRCVGVPPAGEGNCSN